MGPISAAAFAAGSSPATIANRQVRRRSLRRGTVGPDVVEQRIRETPAPAFMMYPHTAAHARRQICFPAAHRAAACQPTRVAWSRSRSDLDFGVPGVTSAARHLVLHALTAALATIPAAVPPPAGGSRPSAAR